MHYNEPNEAWTDWAGDNQWNSRVSAFVMLLETPLAARPLCSSRLTSLVIWMTPEAFGDGPELYQAVCEHGLEGIVAKRTASPYRPGYRGWWIKVKNPAYWRRESEIELIRRQPERAAA